MVVARSILEGNTGTPSRSPRRGNGLVAPGSGAIRSREKMIETWPDITDRLLEEWD
jgi:hypothetical protein